MKPHHRYIWLSFHCFPILNKRWCRALPPLLKIAANSILKRWGNKPAAVVWLSSHSLSSIKRLNPDFSVQPSNFTSSFLKLNFNWWLSYHIYFSRSFQVSFLSRYSFLKEMQFKYISTTYDNRATPIYLRSKSALFLHNSHICDLL